MDFCNLIKIWLKILVKIQVKAWAVNMVLLAMLQKPFAHAKQSAIDAFKTDLKRAIKKKTAEAPGYLIGNEIANKIKEVSKTSQHNHSETVANEQDKEIPKEIYISPEEKQEIID